MIPLNVSIHDDGLFAKLDALDSDVKKATKDTTLAIAQTGVQAILGFIDSQNLIKTGNLRRSIGFNMQGGGKYNIFNYNATASPTHHFKSKTVFAQYYMQPPPLPTDPYTANIFCLASYGVYLEYGTRYMGARPFFGPGIQVAEAAAVSLAIAQFAKHNISHSAVRK